MVSCVFVRRDSSLSWRRTRHDKTQLPVTSPKCRCNGDTLMNQIAQISRDMLESLKNKIACGPPAYVFKGFFFRPKDMVDRIEIQTVKSMDDMDAGETAGHGSRQGIELTGRACRTRRNVHQGLEGRGWEGSPIKKGLPYALGDLVIGELIGKGEHGNVHKGYIHAKTVAVKCAYTSPEASSSLNVPPELEFMSGICHPNLVQIYGVHCMDKDWGSEVSTPNSEYGTAHESPSFQYDPYCQRYSDELEENPHSSWNMIVMEYCDKGNLWEAVKRGEFCIGGKRGAPDYRMILETALEICLAMQRLHDHGIIHGDLKAKNVLLCGARPQKKFIAKVGDFGLCRKPQVSSVDHMAPETLRDGKLHNATDVFSFGVLMYELITGERPFRTMGTTAILVAIVEGMRPKIPSTCPPYLTTLIHECWHQDWKCRPSFNVILCRLVNALA